MEDRKQSRYNRRVLTFFIFDLSNQKELYNEKNHRISPFSGNDEHVSGLLLNFMSTTCPNEYERRRLGHFD